MVSRKRPEIKRALVTMAAGLLALASSTKAQDFSDPYDYHFDLSDYLSRNAFGFLPVPIIVSEPAFQGGYGLMGLFFHETEEGAKRREQAMLNAKTGADKYIFPPNVSTIIGVYSFNDSRIFGAGHLGFFDEGRIRYTGAITEAIVNIDYHGTPEIYIPTGVPTTNDAVAFSNQVLVRVGDSPVSLGAAHSYITSHVIVGIEETFLGASASDVPFANQVVTNSGASLIAEYDTRDNFFSPQEGVKASIKYTKYHEVILSEINFDEIDVEFLSYVKISDRFRMNFRFGGKATYADQFLPPFAQPIMSIRGVPAGRYQGNRVAMSEVELVHQINSRWSVNVFTGAGRVGTETKDLLNNPSIVASGFGFRYLLARRYGLETGLDVAYGPERTIYYITVGTAW